MGIVVVSPGDGHSGSESRWCWRYRVVLVISGGVGDIRWCWRYSVVVELCWWRDESLFGPSQPVADDSLVEEVEPVQPKRKYTRRSKPTKKNDKEFVKPWTMKEEIALCKAFVAKSKDSVKGNGKKATGFWREVAEHFHEEMGEDKRSYDSVNCKWKNRIRPKRKESSSEYLRIKERELELEE
nr:hypothetical protein [Tanacetum cinerariifolium]